MSKWRSGLEKQLRKKVLAMCKFLEIRKICVCALLPRDFSGPGWPAAVLHSYRSTERRYFFRIGQLNVVLSSNQSTEGSLLFIMAIRSIFIRPQPIYYQKDLLVHIYSFIFVVYFIMFIYTGCPISYRQYILKVTQPSQYKYKKIRYRFAVIPRSPSILNSYSF